jgi:hypothetical protein
MMQLPNTDEAYASLQKSGFVLAHAVLPKADIEQLTALAVDVVTDFGVHITRQSGDETLDYHVVTGDRIRASAAPLFGLYAADSLLAWARCATRRDHLSLSSHLQSAININYLNRTGQHYPWHVDAVPFTALLFLTTLPKSAGGEFLIRTPGTRVTEIRPNSGDLLLMDGHRCPHAVAPLRQNACRLTVPMVYPAQQLKRPAGLDDYLYGPMPRNCSCDPPSQE